MSLRNRLAAYFMRHHTTWIAKGAICDLAREVTGATGEHTGRRLRELESAGVLEVKLVKSHAWYRLKDMNRTFAEF